MLITGDKIMNELEYAQSEAALNRDIDAYFKARPSVDKEVFRKFFELGYLKGYNAALEQTDNYLKEGMST